MQKFKFILISLTFISCKISFAQESETVTSQVWLSFNVSKSFATEWYGFTNPEYYNLIEGAEKWRTLALISGIEYYPNNRFDTFFHLYLDYTVEDTNNQTTEFRPIVGGRWNITLPERRVFVKAQFKYEFRFFNNISESTRSNSNRFRVRPEAIISLIKPNVLQDKNLNLRIYGEYFMNLDKNIEERFWNQATSAIGLQYRSSFKWRYELRYLTQGSKNNIEEERPSTINHIVYALVSLNF